MQLLRDQAKSARDLAETNSKQLEELRRGRAPLLRCQSPQAKRGWPVGQLPSGGEFVEDRLIVTIVLRNDGGPARIREVEIQCVPQEDFTQHHFDVPSTIPAGEVLDFVLRTEKQQAIQYGERRLTIRMRYGDLLNEHEWETKPVVGATFEDHRAAAKFIDSDERSPDERLIR